jgi:D-threo-aldose 1-dehydrogenase
MINGVRDVVLGGAQLGNLYQPISEGTAAAIVEAAWDAGVRAFDTAPHYGLGLSERRLGRALAGLPREQLRVSTKVGRVLEPVAGGARGRMDDQGFAVPTDLVRRWDFSAAGVRRSLEESLERLRLDRVDVVYVHDPDDHLDEAIDAALPALADLRDQGVVGAIGAGMNDASALARIVREADVDAVMCAGRYTLLRDEASAELFPAARAAGVGVVLAGVFNSGLLATATPAEGAPFDYGAVDGAILDRARRIAAVCAVHGTSLPAAALAWAGAPDVVAALAIGAQSPAQLTESLALLAAPPPDALWTDLAERGLLTPAKS